jgi:hypothetical protein
LGHVPEVALERITSPSRWRLEILVFSIKPGLLVSEGQVFSVGHKFFVLRQVQFVIFQM